MLDPACGSGNFLYLALQALKDPEHRVQLEAEADLGFQRAFPEVGPANVKGIEINPYAAELAGVSVWIGEIQWMRRNGFAEARDPVLKPLDTIECRDAILTADGTEPLAHDRHGPDVHSKLSGRLSGVAVPQAESSCGCVRSVTSIRLAPVRLALWRSALRKLEPAR